MATRLTPFWPRPATTSGSLWPGSGLCALYSGPLSGSSHTAAAPLHHKLKRLNSLFHRRPAIQSITHNFCSTDEPSKVLEQVYRGYGITSGREEANFV